MNPTTNPKIFFGINNSHCLGNMYLRNLFEVSEIESENGTNDPKLIYFWDVYCS